MEYLKSELTVRYSEMRQSNEYLVQSLKEAYDDNRALCSRIEILQKAIKQKRLYDVDLQDKNYRKTDKFPIKNRPGGLNLLQAKGYCRNMAEELECYMNQLIKIILDPISGFLGVPPKKSLLPVRLKRSCSAM